MIQIERENETPHLASVLNQERHPHAPSLQSLWGVAKQHVLAKAHLLVRLSVDESGDEVNQLNAHVQKRKRPDCEGWAKSGGPHVSPVLLHNWLGLLAIHSSK